MCVQRIQGGATWIRAGAVQDEWSRATQRRAQSFDLRPPYQRITNFADIVHQRQYKGDIVKAELLTAGLMPTTPVRTHQRPTSGHHEQRTIRRQVGSDKFDCFSTY